MGHREFWNEWKYFDDTVRPVDPPQVDGRKWEKYFSQLYDDPSRPDLLPSHPTNEAAVNPINASYTMEELDKTVKKLKPKKAAGKDKLLAEFVKATNEPTRRLLLRMINLIYTTNIVPKSWCQGIITPIHKEGPKDDPDNYRGICIGGALSKILCMMMNDRLTDYAKTNKLIHESQIGFLTLNRTADHILSIKSLVNKYVTDEKGKLYVCFIDFRKAFDTVWHQGLFHKLEAAGIVGNFMNTLKDIYLKTECAVKLGNRVTQFFKCKKGVRQGDPLSPLLFNIYLNGIFDQLQANECDPVTFNGTDKINALAYADDIVLISRTREGLQRALDTTQEYCENWKLQVNHKKTQCMTFTRGTQKEKTTFRINNIPLQNVKEYKYLGIIVNKKNCTFNPAIKALRTKATRAIYAIKSKVNIHKLPIRIAMKLFDALVKPILLYASETWEPFLNQDHDKWDSNEIERAHMLFIKQVLGVNRSATNVLVRGEINRHSLQREVIKRNIKFIGYITQKDDKSIVKQALTYEKERENPITFLSTMYKHSEELQQEHGQFFPYMYPYDNLLDISEEKLRRYTMNIFNRIWKSKLEESIKGETYKGFKSHPRYEPFLDQLNRKLRRTLIKFRTSDHKLMIEEGRHSRPKIPREHRYCRFCSNQVEDEIHMLINCQLYGNRDQWLHEIGVKFPHFNTLDSHQKFIFLMTQEDEQITLQIAEKITHWFELRELLNTNFYL